MAQIPPTPPTEEQLQEMLLHAQQLAAEARALVLAGGDQELADALMALIAAANAVLALYGLPLIEV